MLFIRLHHLSSQIELHERRRVRVPDLHTTARLDNSGVTASTLSALWALNPTRNARRIHVVLVGDDSCIVTA